MISWFMNSPWYDWLLQGLQSEVQNCDICRWKGIQKVRKGNQRCDPQYDSYDSRWSLGPDSFEGSVW